MVAGLGAAWILDGLQITIASSVTGVLIQPDTLDMTSSQVGLIATVYLVGQVVGALVFGRLSDQLGRKRLLIVTLLLYLFGTGLAAFTVNDGGWFWLVSALAIVGEVQRARDLMEKLLRIASPLGLYAEEFDAETGRHLGNFPQAFSHLALIEAAARIIVAERLEEIS